MTAGLWQCPRCGAFHSANVEQCHCGERRPSDVDLLAPNAGFQPLAEVIA